MTKEQYLNYVMLTDPKNFWGQRVSGYIIDNNIENWKEGFNFVVKWVNDPPYMAFVHALLRLAKPEWAMEVIENSTRGKQIFAADQMVKYGYAPKTWGDKIYHHNK